MSLRHRLLSLAVLGALSASGPAASAAERAFDASAFKKAAEAPAAAPAPAPVKREAPKERVLPLMMAEAKSDAEKIKVRIMSVTALLKREKNPATIRKLRWTRGASYYQQSKLERLAAGSKNLDKADPLLRLADEDLAFVEGAGGMTAAQKAQLVSIRGMIAVDLGKYDEGKARLREAIALNPKADAAIGLSMYLADDAYYGERLAEALTEYQRFLNVMGPKDKAKALYKIAWIHLKQERVAEAEKILFALAKMKPEDLGEMRKDVLADLAATEPALRSDVEILKLLQTELKLAPDEEIVFLNQVLLALQGEKKPVSPEVYERMFAVERRPFERLSLRLQRARQAHGDSLTKTFQLRFAEMRKEYEAAEAATKAELMKQLGSEMQAETELMVAQLAEQLLRAIRKGDAAAKEKHAWAVLLKNQMTFLDGNFKVKARADLFRLWLDVCASDKDWACVLDRVGRISKDADLATLREGARLEEIAALEELSKTDEAAHRPRLIAALTEYVKDPKRPDWASVAKRLVAFHIADKDYDKALPLLRSIDAGEKSEDSYYRLQLARYQSGRDAELVKDDRSKSFPTERIADLLRETHLRLAQTASQSDANFGAYEGHLKEYLARTDDDAKKIALLRGYYGKLEAKGDFAKLSTEILALPPERRFHPELQEFPRRLVARSIEAGDIARVPPMIGPLTMATPEDLRFTEYLARLSLQPQKMWPEVGNLKDGKRQRYVLGLLALGLPDAMETYNRTHPRSPRDIRDMAFLAMKLRRCDQPLTLTPAQRAELGDAVPLALQPQPSLPVEKSIAQVVFPKAKKLTKASTERMMKTLDVVRSQRKAVTTALKGQVPDVQIRLLEKAAKLEKGAVDMLISAPQPAGLSPEQSQEYANGVKQMADEFVQQEAQFTKAAEDIRAQVKALEEKERTPVKRPASMEAWPWPADGTLKALRERAKTKALLPALLELDLLRSVTKMEDGAYWSARAGLLLSKSPCQATVDYVYKELSSNGQTELIKQWSAL